MAEKLHSTHCNQKDKTLKLHKEEMEICKKLIETAQVKIYKKTYTHDKQLSVPVTCEDLIIEKKTVNSNSMNDQIETIRIPLSEERIRITLQPVILENIDIYKRQYKELIQIHETLKEEKPRIDTIGEIKVQDNQSTSVTYNNLN